MPDPPFDLTPELVAGCERIERLLGKYEGLHAPRPMPELRRERRVRTIRDSLAIEGNALSLDQVSTVLEGKRVAGPPREIQEVRNAGAVYDQLNRFDPFSHREFLEAHGIMMEGLIESAGRFRSRSVGIANSAGKVSHVAPPFENVPGLIKDLFAFARRKTPILSPLIRAAIVHYEIEFIHPFEDGNGRMGRFWQTLLLTRYHPAFEFVPMETMVRKRQQDYYRALAASDGRGKSTPFVEFAIDVTERALAASLEDFSAEPVTPERRLEVAARVFQGGVFSRKEYLRQFVGLSTATASRDLKRGVEIGLFEKTGDKALTQYRCSPPV